MNLRKIIIPLLVALLCIAPAAHATANVAPGYLSNSGRTQSDMQTAFEQEVLFANEHLGAAVETTLVISSGAVTPTAGSGNLFSIDTVGGAANLNNIVDTNVPDGRLLLIRCANPSANPVTVVNGAGGSLPILTCDGANFTFGSTHEWLLLKRTGSNFEEVLRYYGDQLTTERTHLGLGTAALAATGTSGSNVPTNTQAATLYAALGGSTSQAFNVSNTGSANNAVSYTTAAATYAPVAGNSAQTFSVATPTLGAHAVSKTYGDANYRVTRYTALGQSWTAGGSQGPFTHSLGAVPHRIWVTFTCTTAQSGYSVGDEVTCLATGNNTASGWGVTSRANSTTFTIYVGNNGPLAYNVTAGSGANISLAAADWSMNVFAEL